MFFLSTAPQGAGRKQQALRTRKKRKPTTVDEGGDKKGIALPRCDRSKIQSFRDFRNSGPTQGNDLAFLSLPRSNLGAYLPTTSLISTCNPVAPTTADITPCKSPACGIACPLLDTRAPTTTCW